jgi:ADP-ribosylglycohydrolase
MVLGEKLSPTSSGNGWSRGVIVCLEQVVSAGRWSDVIFNAGHGQTLKTTQSINATLPIALFFHEDLFKQRQVLLAMLEAQSASQGMQTALIALAYAIAEAVKNQLNPSLFPKQLAAYLRLVMLPEEAETADSSDLLLNRLESLSHLSLGQPSLSHLSLTFQADRKRNLPQSMAFHVDQPWSDETWAEAILLTFHCFLSTPENLSLSIVRAAQLSNQSPLVCSFVGMLSGAYNGIVGIPPMWRATLNLANGNPVSTDPVSTDPASADLVSTDPVSGAHSATLPTLSTLPTGRSLATLAAQFLAAWSGMYNPATYDLSTLPADSLAVMAPWTTRQL